MTPIRLALLALLLCSGSSPAAEQPPVYVWFEPEWFTGVEGSFGYWTGEAKPTGSWGVAGPGISPEWTQGGESEWNSMGAPADETAAACHREFVVPRGGRYRVWVRYVDHRRRSEPFTLVIAQDGRARVSGELGVQPIVPEGDEYALYWGFSFGWGALPGDNSPVELAAGPARLTLGIDRPGEAWRQVDAVLVTDDLDYLPVNREKPPFGYTRAFGLRPADGAAWRGSAADLPAGSSWKRVALAGRDFSMWTQVEADPSWWGEQSLDSLSLYDVFFQFSPPHDIRDKFHTEFAGRRDLPIMSWPGLLPGLYLGTTPDLSPDAPVREWLERTKTPFYMLTNYAGPQYTDRTGPATYEALAGPLAGQFLGYIHGEALGTPGIALPPAPLGKTRREHVDALGKHLVARQAEAWSQVYKTNVPEAHWSKGISCLSVDSIALAHLFHHLGSQVVGYEEDSTNVHVPMRIAFERGAARQYGGAWINYASGNFGDACNYFTQNPVVPRGAPGWFHSKYAVTDGVSAAWYRKLYYLNYLGGASAIFWEQGLANQWLLPGPGTHPIQLSPFGRATEDFQEFVDRLPDRGEPYTPVAILLSCAHAYERVNYQCKMLGFPEDQADVELRELFNVCWYPSGVVEGLPAAPDVQSMPGGTYGNIFDVLVDRPERAQAIFDYPVVWTAGGVELAGAWQAVFEEYVRRGGTLVVNIEAAKSLPPALLGLHPAGQTIVADQWAPVSQPARPSTPFVVHTVELAGAEPLAWAGANVPLVTRHQVGKGAAIVTLVPRMVGLDERAHPALAYLMNGLTAGLVPVEVRLADGSRPQGEVMYQVNKTRDGYLVLVVNNLGVDKTPSGVARVDRRALVDVVVRTSQPVESVREYTNLRDLPVAEGGGDTEIRLGVPAGDLQVVYITTQ